MQNFMLFSNNKSFLYFFGIQASESENTFTWFSVTVYGIKLHTSQLVE